MLEVAHAGIGHQGLLPAGGELIQQWQVFTVVQHVSHQDQIEPVGFGKKVAGITQLHIIELRIGPAGRQRQRVKVAGHHFQRPGPGGSNRGNAGAGTKVQHALALDPLRLLGQKACECQPAGPAKRPVGRLVENAPGLVGGESAFQVVRIDQPEFERGTG